MENMKLSKLLNTVKSVLAATLLAGVTIPFMHYIGFGMIERVYESNLMDYRKTSYIDSAVSGQTIPTEIRKEVVSIWARYSRGSGVLMEEGVIFTADHVVRGPNGRSFKVYNAGTGKPKTYYKLVGSKALDFAVLVDSKDRVVTSKTLDRLSATKIGDDVKAVGYGEHSPMMMVTSKVMRMDSMRSPYYISVSNPSISGMSGGPLYNSEGKVVGLVSSGYPLYHGYSASERQEIIRKYHDYLYHGIETDQINIVLGEILEAPAVMVHYETLLYTARNLVESKYSLNGNTKTRKVRKING